MTATRKQATLLAAIDHQDLLGQAKGILMERYRVDAQRAFDMLVVTSRTAAATVHEAPEMLTAKGELPAGPPDGGSGAVRAERQPGRSAAR